MEFKLKVKGKLPASGPIQIQVTKPGNQPTEPSYDKPKKVHMFGANKKGKK
jgi:hypothetical protein